ELAPWLNNTLVGTRAPHLVDRTLALLRPLGIHPGVPCFDLPTDPDGEEFAERLCRECQMSENFLVLNPGAGWPSKLWPTQSYARVAKYLGERLQRRSLITWAGPQEHGMAQAIVSAANGHALMAPRTSVTQLVALLRRASGFVGSDTGPLHLAAAVGTPCVALFGPTSPVASGPYGRGHQCLVGESSASAFASKRRGPNTAMRTIEPQRVIEACELLRPKPDALAAA
ncbi:MAG TPA: glycosyltransferase family 9 protein, partial [Pirellulaceae bacterium]